MDRAGQNELYNPDFSLGQAGADFPDGWEPAGGTPATAWRWLGQPGEAREVQVTHPGPGRAGIRQVAAVYLPVQEGQRWLLSFTLRAEQPGQAVYAGVAFGTPAGYVVSRAEFSWAAGPAPTTYRQLAVVPPGAGAARVEVGLGGPGALWLREVTAGRVYPPRVLRLDERGRAFVRRVGEVGRIVEPVRLAGPLQVNVRASVAADIRDLQYTRDSVTVYGSGGLPLQTNPSGQLQVETAGSAFREEWQSVVTTDSYTRSAARDISRLRLYSFAVLNSGLHPALVGLVISPDSLYWVENSPEQELAPGSLTVFTPRVFLRYMALRFRSAVSGQPTTLAIWFQAQA